MAILLYSRLKKLLNPQFKITVAYGDDDIFGNSMKYVRERYATANFFTISASSHFPWLHNEQAFYSILSNHFETKNPFGNPVN